MESISFGEKLKNYRTALDLTQTDLGGMLNVSQVTVANYERGERFPKQKTLLAIAEIFDVSLDDLLEAPKKLAEHQIFPDSHHFDVESLIRILLDSPVEEALTYTASWKNTENLDLVSFYEEIIAPVLVRTGELWFKGEILVSEEHLISDKIRELILLHANREWERHTVSPVKYKKWMGFCAPGEKHYLALLMLGQVLRLAGWNIYYLGTQIPFRDLLGIIKKYSPDVLGISITMADNAEGLDLFIRQIREKIGEHPPIILGGPGAAQISNDTSAYIHGSALNLKDGVRMAEELVKRK